MQPFETYWRSTIQTKAVRSPLKPQQRGREGFPGLFLNLRCLYLYFRCLRCFIKGSFPHDVVLICPVSVNIPAVDGTRATLVFDGDSFCVDHCEKVFFGETPLYYWAIVHQNNDWRVTV